MRLALELAASKAMADLVGERVMPIHSELRTDAGIDDWLLRTVGTADHISGTCKMGPPADPMAVVAEDGRVHGLDSIRVVDASIFPSPVRANLNASTMMVAEWVADLIRQGQLPA